MYEDFELPEHRDLPTEEVPPSQKTKGKNHEYIDLFRSAIISLFEQPIGGQYIILLQEKEWPRSKTVVFDFLCFVYSYRFFDRINLLGVRDYFTCSCPFNYN